ncbi:MAG: alpha/beta hydrolase, partial [Cytophagales bacterium]
PFLDKNCFYDFSNKAISVIYTENGGHVGFLSNSLSDFYWLEKQIISFLEK